MNIQDKRVVIGMDFDSAEEAIPSTYARRIDNCRVNIVNNGNDGIVEPIIGNSEVINTLLPTGINKTIGSHSDTTKNRIFYFNWNSNDQDGLYVFDGIGFEQIVIGDMGWDESLNIHSITLINNLLTWVEGGEKYPRQVDIHKPLINPDEFNLSLIKTPPTFPLTIKVQSTALSEPNFYKNETYYYIYRFGYDNGQQSSWSPYSKLVSSKYSTFNLDDASSSTFKINELRVFRAGGIDGLNYNTRIKFIDFAYANTYLGPFKLFKRTLVENVVTVNGWDQIILADSDLSLYGTNEDLEVTFRNDISLSVISSTDTDRPYDDIWPAETIVDTNNRNIIGNTLEGFSGFDIEIGNVQQGYQQIEAFTYPTSASSVSGSSLAELVGNFMTWKNNSKYGIGLVFYNEFGQKSGVYTDQRMKVLVPADYRQATNDSLWTFSFDLAGIPPDWATHYQVVRTNNNSVVRFAQGISNDVLYVSSYDPNGDPVVIGKDIGYTRGIVITEVEVKAYIPFMTTTLQRRVESMLFSGDSGGDSSANRPIDEGGTLYGDKLVVRITYWYNIFGNWNLLDNPTFYPQKTPSYNTNEWVGIPDNQVMPGYRRYNGSLTMEPVYEEDYVIGYIPQPDTWVPPFTTEAFSGSGGVPGNRRLSLYASNIPGEPIYIGGVNRRGEKVDIFTKDGLDQAVDILIDIYNWNNNTTFEENKFNSNKQVAKDTFNPSCETPYVYQAGDILNIYYSANGTYVGINDLEIKDFITGRYLKVKYDSRLLDGDIVGPGAFIEINTPNKSADDTIFYEYGDCYPILNPKTANRAYSKTEFNIYEGDTHYMMYSELYSTDIRVNYRKKDATQFKTGQGYFTYPFFSMTPDNLNRMGVWEKANGRANVVLLDGERQTRRQNTIRYSDRYIDGATINGTSTFYAFNALQLDYDWGAIRKLTSQEEVIMANCEQEVALIYVNKSMLSTSSGSDSLIISDQVLNSPKKLPGGYGCVNPESVSQYDQYIYFYSKQKGAALRYNVFNSIFDISGNYKARSYFLNKQTNRCVTGFDPKFRTQYFRFDDENIGFIDPPSQDYPNTWSSFFSYLPEKFAYIQLQLYSFKDGKLYKHEDGPVNTFYGVKYPSKVNILFNSNPNIQKIANFISQEADIPLWCEQISNQDGQITTIEDGAFERINKDWQCDVPGDTSTGLSKWEGDLISSHLCNVTFRYDGNSLFRLRYLNLYSQISQRTNK